MKKVLIPAIVAMFAVVPAAHADDYKQKSDSRQGYMDRSDQSDSRQGYMDRGVQSIEPAAGEYGSQRMLNSSDVRDIQQSLRNHGYNPGPVDGIVGPRTRGALRAFQRDNELTASGQITGSTLDRLGLDMGQ